MKEEKIIKTIEGKHGSIIRILEPEKKEFTEEDDDNLHKSIAEILLRDYMKSKK